MKLARPEKTGPQETPVASLHPHPGNPRTIKPERLEQLKRNLEADREMLNARPLIALPDGTVIAGNMRLRAAQELGWETIPVVTVDLDEDRAALWALRDNRPFGEDDPTLTADILRGLGERGVDLDLSGFMRADIDALLRATNGTGAPDPDATPPAPVEPRSERGEIYELGPHRVMCGDAFSQDDRDALLGDVTVGCAVLDPPYGIDLDTDFSKANGGRVYTRVIGDDHAFDAAPLLASLDSVGEQFWFGANYYRRTLSDDDRDGSWLVWDKRTPETDSVVGSGFELIWSRRPHKQDVLRSLWTNYTSHTNAGLRREHPTEKPVALLAEILGRWASQPDPVVDLFAGAGTLVIAAEQLGLPCLAMEIDPAYVDVIRQRYADFTGQPELAP